MQYSLRTREDIVVLEKYILLQFLNQFINIGK